MGIALAPNTNQTGSVEYVLTDDSKQPITAPQLTPQQEIAKKLAMLNMLHKRIVRRKMRARELNARVTRNRKADKAAKAARRRNRKKK